MKIGKAIIHADGASLGNPGPAAIGATIKDEQGQLLDVVTQRIGRATNNQAEYKAVIAALEKAVRLGAREIEINLDSELLVRQVSGEYRVRNPALKPLYQQVKRLQGRLKGCVIAHIPRQQNVEAHRLANRALKDFG